MVNVRNRKYKEKSYEFTRVHGTMCDLSLPDTRISFWFLNSDMTNRVLCLRQAQFITEKIVSGTACDQRNNGNRTPSWVA